MEDDEASDEALVALARVGDAAAFRALVARYRRRLTAAAQRRLPAALRGRVSSSDVVQECLLVAHRRLVDFEDRGDGSFGRWLSRILENKVSEEIRDNLKRRRRTAHREVRLPSKSEGKAFVDREPSPGARAAKREDHTLAIEALAALPEDHRTILRLVHEGGLTVPQAAVQMARSAEAGRKLYARAVANLAKAVEARRSRSA